MGHFGGRTDETAPLSIEVTTGLKLFNNIEQKVISANGLKLERTTGDKVWKVGQTQYGYSMSYLSPLVMLKSWTYPFSTVGETIQNHCQVEFPETTHVIKILFNGG
jgi:hypothetical protein